MGSERVLEGPIMAPKTWLGPFGPILAYFGARNFSKSFWAKKGQIFSPNVVLNYFDSHRVRDPQNPKIDPVDPPVNPILAHFVAKRPILGVKKTCFSRKNIFAPNHFLSVPRWSGTLKNRKLPLYTPQWTLLWPILWAFWANLG